MSHEYKIKFDFKREIGSFTADEIRGTDSGATDAFVFVSILYPKDGSYSMHFSSVDGRNNGEPLSDDELFKVWSLLSKRLSEGDLSESKKQFVSSVWDAIKRAVLGAK